LSGPLERLEGLEGLEASDLNYEGLVEPKASSGKVSNISAIQKSKPIPKEYPQGFSFWETDEYAEAIKAAAEEADLSVSNWLRQTVRVRLRLEGWVARPSRHPLARGGNG
jgi:hypothetical protein